MTDTYPDTPEKVLARIIDSSAPDTLLCCGATARSAGEVWIAARPEGHLLTPDPANPNADMPPAERVDLALITDTLEHLNQDEGALLLPYVIVAPKGVADRDMVAKWLNYIASAAPQERGVALSGYIPGNNDAKATDEIVRKLGMPFDELRAKLYQPDWDFIARHQKERVDAIEKMMAEL